MKRGLRQMNWVLQRVFGSICRIDLAAIRSIPAQGPLILVGNHINFLEAPVLLSYLDPRPVTGLAKRESWDNPLFHFLFNQWEIIPIDRGMVDREAFRLALDALEERKILAVSPEGTRSRDGRLLQGKPGVLALAAKSGAPMMAVGFHGHENFWDNFKRLRRTDFHVEVGRPFCLASGADALQRDARQPATDEIMYKIAELLPERYHGYYQGAREVKYQYLVDA
jgi:1-acyl-sn-glycerol-3-phosphate acyltransferase